MKEKIVVLNSGGFDSVVLLHDISNKYVDSEIHTLHFEYGNLNATQQRICARKVAEKLGCVFVPITLPQFGWTKSDFYTEDSFEYNTQYLEYRNLIFISYALSYAESIGATKVFLATLKSHGYKDTSSTFFYGLNYFTKTLSNIEIVTPYSEMEKDELIPIATACKVKYGEYFSCDVPNKDGSPCDECLDCESLKYIDEILKEDHHFKRYLNTFNLKDIRFKDLLEVEPIKEMRLLINNKCQLKCSHCFYGFDEMIGEQLDKEILYNAIVEASKLGVENIHFSGKEPLFDDDILYYARRIKEDNLPLTFDLVTNGINVPKYLEPLKKYGLNRIYISVDEVLGTSGVRSVKNVAEKAIQCSLENDVPVEIFIDLHKNNCNKVDTIIEYLLDKYPDISKFYIRTIHNIGSAQDILLTEEELDTVFKAIHKVSKFSKCLFSLNIGYEYEETVFRTQSLIKAVNLMDSYRSNMFTNNFSIVMESYCTRYLNQITLTPDGYVLGCAMEVSQANYDEISVGNIKDCSLDNLIHLGKKVLRTCNDDNDGSTACKRCRF